MRFLTPSQSRACFPFLVTLASELGFAKGPGSIAIDSFVFYHDGFGVVDNVNCLRILRGFQGQFRQVLALACTLGFSLCSFYYAGDGGERLLPSVVDRRRMFCFCILEKSHKHVKERSWGLLRTDIRLWSDQLREVVIMSVFDGLWSGKMVVRTFQALSAGRQDVRKGGCYRKDALGYGGVWWLPLTDRGVGCSMSTTVDGPCLMFACVVQGLRVVELSRPRLVNFG